MNMKYLLVAMFVGLMGAAILSAISYNVHEDGNINYNQEKLTVVYGTLHFTADVTSPPKQVGMPDLPVKVEAQVDGQPFVGGVKDPKKPGHFLVDVDTTKLQDGKHMLTVVATWGNQTIGSESKDVIVDNTDAKKQHRIS